MDKYFHESEESASYKNKLYQYYKQRNNLVYGSNYETLKDRIDAKINEIENEYSLSYECQRKSEPGADEILSQKC